MILLSLLLVPAAVVLLVWGLAAPSQVLVWGSIAATLGAAGALLVSVLSRRGQVAVEITAALPALPPTVEAPDPAPDLSTLAGPVTPRADPLPPAGAFPRAEPSARAHPAEPAEGAPPAARAEPAPPADPPDEPPPEDVPVSTALRAAQLSDEVLVVDGRPRYHLTGCPALGVRTAVRLALSTARRSGFTPCSVCRPDSVLLARSRGARP